MQRATLILGLRQGVFTGRFILILFWQSAVLRIWSIRPEQGELNVIKKSKYHLQFCRFWLVCGTWQNILNSRQNRSKNKLRERHDKSTWKLLTPGGDAAYMFFSGGLEYSTRVFLIKCSLQLSSYDLLLEFSFKTAQVPVSSDNVALPLRSDQYVRREFTL